MKENLGVAEDFKDYNLLFIIKSGLPVNKSLGKPFGINRSQKETDQSGNKTRGVKFKFCTHPNIREIKIRRLRTTKLRLDERCPLFVALG